jgi:hypothetical protein
MEITDFKKNCMGTMDFSLKFKGMRKAEEFCVYPIEGKTDIVYFQSDHRWAQLDLKSKTFEVSARRAQYANSVWFMVCQIHHTITVEKLTDEQFGLMIEKIRETAGERVGNNILAVVCDNSYADKI